MRSAGSLRVVISRLLGAALLVLFVSVWGIGCDSGGGNGGMAPSPVVENEIQNQQANAGDDVIEVGLEQVFSAPSGTPLTYSASSSDEGVASVAVNSATLTVTPLEGGEAEIMVTASNERGEATDAFEVQVFASPPDRP
jgi:hypothetical protein